MLPRDLATAESCEERASTRGVALLRARAAVSYPLAHARTVSPNARIAGQPPPVSEPLAVDGGSAVRSAPFPAQEAPAPAEDGRPLEAFESELAAFVGGERVAIACASHADALRLAFRATALEDCEVVVPALRAEPVARALLAAGLVPVPAEVDPETANLAVTGLARATGERTRAVVVTHAFGHPAAMPELTALAGSGELAVIEDMSDALGASHRRVAAGGLGRVAALGFGAAHLLTGGEGGEGGAVIVDTEAAAEVRRWRDAAGGEPAEASLRVALSELRGAKEALTVRREAAWHLTYELRGVRGLAVMRHGRWIRHGYDRYVVRLRSMLWQRSLEETVEALRAEGIPCAPALGSSLHGDAAVRAALGEDDPRLGEQHFAAASQLPAALIAIPLGAATTTDMNAVAGALRKVAAASVVGDGAERARAR